MTKHNAFFSHGADIRFKRKTKVLKHEAKSLVTPYYNELSHVKSLGSPFLHIAHLVADSFELIANIASFAYFWNGEGVHGFGVQLASIVLDAINCILSTLSLITRTISTLANMGYSERENLISINQVPWVAERFDEMSDYVTHNVTLFGWNLYPVTMIIGGCINLVRGAIGGIEIPHHALNIPDAINHELTYDFDNFVSTYTVEKKTKALRESVFESALRQ